MGLPGEKTAAAQAKRYKAMKDSKVKAHVVEHSAYRWWDEWLSDGRVPHVFTVDVESGAIRDLFAGTKYELVQADTSANYYDISPDGREIAFAFDSAQDKRFDHSYHLVALDLGRKRFRTLTTGSPLTHEYPRYSLTGAGSRSPPRTCGEASWMPPALRSSTGAMASSRTGRNAGTAA